MPGLPWPMTEEEMKGQRSRYVRMDMRFKVI